MFRLIVGLLLILFVIPAHSYGAVIELKTRVYYIGGD